MQSRRKKLVGRKYHSSSKGISGFIQPLIGFVLVAIFAVSLVALFASRTQKLPQTASQPQQPASQVLSPTVTTTVNQDDPTARWKVYKNDRYGYTIKYPPTFFMNEWDTSKDPLRMYYISFVPEKYRDAPNFPEIGLVIYKNPEKIPVRDWLDKHTGDQSQTQGASSALVFEKVVNVEQKTVSDVPALRFVEESPLWGTRAPSVLIPNNTGIFRLFYTNAYTSEDLAQTFELMLSTLQIAP
jgi:hypothetical protein